MRGSCTNCFLEIFRPKMGHPQAVVMQSTRKSCIFGVPPWWYQKVWMTFPTNWFWPKNCIFGLKICSFLRYTHIIPLFWARTDPAQWDHISPISWGNSAFQPAKRPKGQPQKKSYPEFPHDVGKLWYHWVGSFRAQKWGFHGHRVKNANFQARNCP